ncbi:MAG: hypothetical protein KDD06_13110 [Phaeodactylibacter sp.]|nr:hypothetical protein [Phaeodactylibacter sp.]MCB9264340.1 hypothetical protein [Lewinellaceae bacterium]MCB9286072.1 hypothetical protein [Lewinellaceae bacterium]
MQKKFLLADLVVQVSLLGLIVVSSPTIFFPLLLMIPLGGWQLSSALIKGVAWRSRLHLTYFGLAAAYCLALWAGSTGVVEVRFSPKAVQELWGEEAWYILFIVVIPLVGAVKYLHISKKDCGRRTEEKLV